MKNAAKKLASLALALAFLLALLPGSVFAAGDTLADATRISFDRTYNGEITGTNVEDFYSIVLPSSGQVIFNFKGTIAQIQLRLYDIDGNQLWSNYYSSDSTTGLISDKWGFTLTKGTYYWCIERRNSKNGSYTLSASFTSANETFTEIGSGVDNSMDTANAIGFNRSYNGQIALNDSKDFYRIVLPSSGQMSLSFKGLLAQIQLRLYDIDGNQLWSNYYSSDSTTGLISQSIALTLTKGTYYWCIERRNDKRGPYSIEASFTSANETFTENGYGTNNSMETANSIKFNRSYNGQIALNDSKDFYCFVLPYSGHITFSSEAEIAQVYYRLYDVDGKQIWSNYYSSNNAGVITVSKKFELESGTYYLCVERRNDKRGTYSFTLTDTTPGAIATVTAAAAEGMITVNWTESENATAYIIQRRVKDGDTWTTLKSNVTGRSYEDTTGVAGTVYQYRVRGRNGDLYGPFKVSSVVRAIAGAPTPGAIATVTATAAAGKTTVTWSASSGATAYIIQRRVKGADTWTTLKSNVTGRSYVDTTGNAGTVYQYRVRGRNGTSYGPFKVSSVVRALAA